MSSSARQPNQQDRFIAFYDETFAEAYRYAARLCGNDREATEDLVQESYTSLLRQFRADDSRYLQIGYVITAIRNRHLDKLRSAERERRRLHLVVAADIPSEPALMPTQLAALPDRDRAALVLRYVEDLPVAKVAEALGLSVHATESLLVRARARLRGKDARHA